jgi:hypothetical protein
VALAPVPLSAGFVAPGVAYSSSLVHQLASCDPIFKALSTQQPRTGVELFRVATALFVFPFRSGVTSGC